MDGRRQKLLVVLVFTMAIHRVIAQVVSLQQVAITQHWNMMSVLFLSKFVDMPPQFGAHPWRYEKVVGYMKNQFFGSFPKRMFQKCTRLSFDTFHVLIKVVGSNLE
jgi:hypothetical protein